MRRSMGPVSRSFITWETMTYCKFLECTPKSHAHLDEASRYFYVFKDKDTRNPPRCCRRCSPRCYNPSQVGPCKEGVTVLGHERSPTPVRPWLRRTIIATHRSSARRQQPPSVSPQLPLRWYIGLVIPERQRSQRDSLRRYRGATGVGVRTVWVYNRTSLPILQYIGAEHPSDPNRNRKDFAFGLAIDSDIAAAVAGARLIYSGSPPGTEGQANGVGRAVQCTRT